MLAHTYLLAPTFKEPAVADGALPEALSLPGLNTLRWSLPLGFSSEFCFLCALGFACCELNVFLEEGYLTDQPNHEAVLISQFRHLLAVKRPIPTRDPYASAHATSEERAPPHLPKIFTLRI